MPSYFKKDSQPPLTEKETQVLQSVKAKANYYDRYFKVCCCHCGVDTILIWIPIFGDIIGLFISLQLVNLALKADLPFKIKQRMLRICAISFALGFIPFVGAVMACMYQANVRIYKCLKRYLQERAMERAKDASTQIEQPLHAGVSYSDAVVSRGNAV